MYSTAEETLCTGDTILLVARGDNKTWNPTSSVKEELHPIEGYLSAFYHFNHLDSKRFVNNVAGIRKCRPDSNEPSEIISCIFRVEAVINREEILRENLIRRNNKLDSKFFSGYGKEVKYGQSIQLVHVHTNQLLAIDVNERGNDPYTMKVGFEVLEEMQNRNVNSCSASNEKWVNSWFEIQSPVKTKSSGDPVKFNDFIHVASDRWQRFLSLNAQDPSDIKVNAAFDPSKWQVIPFSSNNRQRGVDPYLRGCSVLRLFHLDTSGVLMRQGNLTDLMFKYPKSIAKNSLESKYNEVFLSVPKDRVNRKEKRYCSSDSLWAIEPYSVTWGGQPLVSGSGVRFRHITSNLLLACEEKDGQVMICMVDDNPEKPLPPSTLFTVHLLGSSTGVDDSCACSVDLLPSKLSSDEYCESSKIKFHSYIQIYHCGTKQWLHGIQYKQNMHEFVNAFDYLQDKEVNQHTKGISQCVIAKSLKELHKRNAFRHCELVCCNSRLETDAFLAIQPESMEMCRVLQVLAARMSLRYHAEELKRIVHARGIEEVTFSDVRPMEAVMKALRSSLTDQDATLGTNPSDSTAFGFTEVVFPLTKVEHFQLILLEQGVVVGLLYSMKRAIYDRIHTSMSEGGGDNGTTYECAGPPQIDQLAKEVGQIIYSQRNPAIRSFHDEVFRLTAEYVKFNTVNQLSVAPFIPVMEVMLGACATVPEALSSIVQANRLYLLNISQEQVAKTLDRIESVGLVSEYLGYLETLCELDGRVIHQNQILLGRELLVERPHLLPKLRVVQNKHNEVVAELNVPVSGMGWLLFNSSLNEGIVEYVVAALHLVARLCQNRNKVVQQFLWKETQSSVNYNFDDLYSLLNVPSLPDSVKAAVCDLMGTLHVDRAPFTVKSNVQMTRSWINPDETLSCKVFLANDTANDADVEKEQTLDGKEISAGSSEGNFASSRERRKSYFKAKRHFESLRKFVELFLGEKTEELRKRRAIGVLRRFHAKRNFFQAVSDISVPKTAIKAQSRTSVYFSSSPRSFSLRDGNVESGHHSGSPKLLRTNSSPFRKRVVSVADFFLNIDYSLFLAVLKLCAELVTHGEYIYPEEIRRLFSLLEQVLKATEVTEKEPEMLELLRNTPLELSAGSSSSSSATKTVNRLFRKLKHHRTRDGSYNNMMYLNMAVVCLKLEVCEIMYDLYNIHMNNQVSKLIVTVKDRFQESTEDNSDTKDAKGTLKKRASSSILSLSFGFREDQPDMDFDSIFREIFIKDALDDSSSFSETLCRLSIHRCKQLADLVYDLIEFHTEPVLKLLKTVTNLTLLLDEKTIDLHEKLVRIYVNLNKYTKSRPSRKETEYVLENLESIEHLLHRTQSTYKKRARKLMLNLGIHRLVFSLLKVSSDSHLNSNEGSNGGDTNSKSVCCSKTHNSISNIRVSSQRGRKTVYSCNSLSDNLSAGRRMAYRILITLVGSESDLQHYLFSQLDFFLSDLMEYPREASTLVRSIIRGNRELVSSISSDQVKKLIKALTKMSCSDSSVPPQSRVLDVLHQIVICGEEAIQQNQNMVVQALLTTSPERTIILYASDNGYDERVKIMEELQLSSEVLLYEDEELMNDSTVVESSQLHAVECLRYHIRLLELFAACAHGKNHLTEVQCRSLLTFDELARGIEDPRTILPVRKALILFLNTMYIDVQVPIPGLLQSAVTWGVLDRCRIDIEALSSKKSFVDYFEALEDYHSEEELSTNLTHRYCLVFLRYVTEVMCPIVLQFYLSIFDYNKRESGPSNLHYFVTQGIITAACRVLEMSTISKSLRDHLVDLSTCIWESDPAIARNLHDENANLDRSPSPPSLVPLTNLQRGFSEDPSNLMTNSRTRIVHGGSTLEVENREYQKENNEFDIPSRLPQPLLPRLFSLDSSPTNAMNSKIDGLRIETDSKEVRISPLSPKKTKQALQLSPKSRIALEKRRQAFRRGGTKGSAATHSRGSVVHGEEDPNVNEDDIENMQPYLSPTLKPMNPLGSEQPRNDEESCLSCSVFNPNCYEAEDEEQEEIRQFEDHMILRLREMLTSTLGVQDYHRFLLTRTFRMLEMMREKKMDTILHDIIRQIDLSVEWGGALTKTHRRSIVEQLQFVRWIVEGFDGYSPSFVDPPIPSDAEQYDQQCRLSRLGASVLVLKLISSEQMKYRTVLKAVLALGLSLLRNGNKQVQKAMYHRLSETKLDEPFFAGLVRILRLSVQRIRSTKHQSMLALSKFGTRLSSVNSSTLGSSFMLQSNSFSSVNSANHSARSSHMSMSEDGESTDGFDRSLLTIQDSGATTNTDPNNSLLLNSGNQIISILEFLRLLCEDHFTPMQRYLSFQPDNFRTHDVVDEVVSYLRAIQWIIDPTTNRSVWNIDATLIDLSCQLLYTLIEFAQGCEENQAALANAKLCYALNDLLSQDYVIPSRPDFTDCNIQAVKSGVCSQLPTTLKTLAMLLLYSMVEGNHDPEVGNRIISHIDFFAVANFAREMKKSSRVCYGLVNLLSSDEKICNYDPNKELVLQNGDVVQGYIACLIEKLNMPQRKLILDLKIDTNFSRRDICAALEERRKEYWHACCTTSMAIQTIASLSNLGQKELEGEEVDPDRTGERLLSRCSALLMWKPLQNGLGAVEIIRHGRLERLYFPIPDICSKYWEDPSIRESRKRIKYLSTKDNQVDKLELFHTYSALLLEEIRYCAYNAKFKFRLKIVNREKLWMNLTFWLAVILNLINLTDQEIAKGQLSPLTSPLHFISIILGIIHFGLSAVRTLCYILSRKQYFVSGFKWDHSINASTSSSSASASYSSSAPSSGISNGSRQPRYMRTGRRMTNVITSVRSKLLAKTAENQRRWTDDKACFVKYRQSMCWTDIKRWFIEVVFVVWKFWLYLIGGTSASEILSATSRDPEHSKTFPGLTSSSSTSVNNPSFVSNSVKVAGRDLQALEDSTIVYALVLRNSKYNLFYLLMSFVACLSLLPNLNFRGLRLVCFSTMLLDICVRHRTLRNVLAAFKQNRDSLGQTLLLVLVCVFIYTAVGFSAFYDNYRLGDEENTGCRSVFECMVTHFNQGLREDTGIASTMEVIPLQDAPALSIARLFFDVSYWLVITVLLLNIVSGIIIDAFGELRDTRSRIDDELEQNCFICGIGSMKFQRYGDGFDNHVCMEHNMWQYVFLQQYLISKDKSEFTGQESYVWKMLRDGNTSFYPIGKSISLRQNGATEEDAD